MVQQDVLDYIRKTPHNSNVNVVKGMLNAKGGDSEGMIPFAVNAIYDSETEGYTLDKTAGEIINAFENTFVYIKIKEGVEGEYITDSMHKVITISLFKLKEDSFDSEESEESDDYNYFAVTIQCYSNDFKCESTVSFDDVLNKYPQYSK